MASAWTYSDWITQATDALRLSRLRLHIQEVSDSLARVKTTEEQDRTTERFDLQNYLESLHVEEKALRSTVGAAATVGSTGLRFLRTIPPGAA